MMMISRLRCSSECERSLGLFQDLERFFRLTFRRFHRPVWFMLRTEILPGCPCWIESAYPAVNPCRAVDQSLGRSILHDGSCELDPVKLYRRHYSNSLWLLSGTSEDETVPDWHENSFGNFSNCLPRDPRLFWESFQKPIIKMLRLINWWGSRRRMLPRRYPS